MTKSGLYGAIGAVAMLLGSSSAFATVTQYHASGCYYAGGGNPTANAAGQLGNQATSPSILWCPVDYDVTVPTKVVVSGYTNGCTTVNGQLVYGLTAKVCAAHANGGSANCWTVQNPPSGCTPGVTQIQSLVPAIQAGDYLYTEVTLGAPIGTGANASYTTFFGYNVTH